MITREYVSPYLLRAKYNAASRSVACRCKAFPGEQCKSTGGGNAATVPLHKARWDRISHWSEERLAAALALVRGQGNTWWPRLPDGYYAETEAAATPIVVKVKTVTPKGVRLSEQQAERIEFAAANGGVYHVSTAHFHGDAADRQSVNALEEKGILRFVELTHHGYERRMELTEFGWKVYHQHRLVIRRVPDEQHPPICSCRPKDAFEQVAQVNAIPEAQPVKAELADRWEALRREVPPPPLTLRRVSAEGRAKRRPLSPIRTGSNVVDITARLAARHTSTPDGGAAC